jgi:serine/threonine protein kinase
MVASGTYGQVSFTPDGQSAVKTSFLFEGGHNSNLLCGCNLNEAIIAATLVGRGNNMGGIINVKDVGMSEDDRVLSIVMDKGSMTLASFVRRHTMMQRMAKIYDVLIDLIKGLHNLHEIGLVHCDFKPENAVFMDDGRTKIIDFGSSRYYRRARCMEDMDVWCTYPYCAPEALEEDEHKSLPTPAMDAYSLGATLYYYIYKTYLYKWSTRDTKADIRRLHRQGFIRDALPDNCPHGVPLDVFSIMIGLLKSDPQERTSIKSVYNHFFQPPPPPAFSHIINDPPSPSSSSRTARDRAIDYLYNRCGTKKECFALAVNIMDRYEACKGGTCSMGELTACLILSEITLYPDVDAFITRKKKEQMLTIIRALKFKLYADTPDWLILDVYKHPVVDYDVLKMVLKESQGMTHVAIDMYLEQRDYMVLDDDVDE